MTQDRAAAASGSPVSDDEAARLALDALLAWQGGDVVLLTDARLRIVLAGADAAELAARSRQELQRMSLVAAFGSAALDALARRALDTEAPVSGEAALGHLGARLFRVDVIPTALPGLLLVLHDVTTVRQGERMRRDFVANVSHELRTPLASVKLLAETLSSGAAEDPAVARDFAQQIEREVDHLAQLVDELLELSLIETGEVQLSRVRLAPGELVEAAVGRMRGLGERRRIRVVSVAPADREAPSVLVLVDPERIGQALVNLVHNAVKYSHPGGEVRVGWERHGGRVRLTVADDGIGIPAAHQTRIFERFYKVDRSRARTRDDSGGAEEPEWRTGSAGLGLSIVRHLAEAHGGSAGVESREGAGSTFWIELPVSR